MQNFDYRRVLADVAAKKQTPVLAGDFVRALRRVADDNIKAVLKDGVLSIQCASEHMLLMHTTSNTIINPDSLAPVASYALYSLQRRLTPAVG